MAFRATLLLRFGDRTDCRSPRTFPNQGFHLLQFSSPHNFTGVSWNIQNICIAYSDFYDARFRYAPWIAKRNSVRNLSQQFGWCLIICFLPAFAIRFSARIPTSFLPRHFRHFLCAHLQPLLYVRPLSLSSLSLFYPFLVFPRGLSGYIVTCLKQKMTKKTLGAISRQKTSTFWATRNWRRYNRLGDKTTRSISPSRIWRSKYEKACVHDFNNGNWNIPLEVCTTIIGLPNDSHFLLVTDLSCHFLRMRQQFPSRIFSNPFLSSPRLFSLPQMHDSPSSFIADARTWWVP